MTGPTRDLTMTCKSCRAGWTAPVLSDVQLARWVAALEASPCPACGAPYRVTSQRTVTAPALILTGALMALGALLRGVVT